MCLNCEEYESVGIRRLLVKGSNLREIMRLENGGVSKIFLNQLSPSFGSVFGKMFLEGMLNIKPS